MLLFRLSEHVFGMVAICVAQIFGDGWRFKVEARRNNFSNAPNEHIFNEPVAVISLFGKLCPGLLHLRSWNVIHDLIISRLSTGQAEELCRLGCELIKKIPKTGHVWFNGF